MQNQDLNNFQKKKNLNLFYKKYLLAYFHQDCFDQFDGKKITSNHSVLKRIKFCFTNLLQDNQVTANIRPNLRAPLVSLPRGHFHRYHAEKEKWVKIVRLALYYFNIICDVINFIIFQPTSRNKKKKHPDMIIDGSKNVTDLKQPPK